MNPNIAIKPAGRKGRGVFTKCTFNTGVQVLRNPVIYISKSEQSAVDKSIMNKYAFYLCGKYLICLGEGSLLNHSDKPALLYSFNKKLKTIDFYAARHIKIGEELTIDYGWEKYPWNKN